MASSLGSQMLEIPVSEPALRRVFGAGVGVSSGGPSDGLSVSGVLWGGVWGVVLGSPGSLRCFLGCLKLPRDQQSSALGPVLPKSA